MFMVANHYILAVVGFLRTLLCIDLPILSNSLARTQNFAQTSTILNQLFLRALAQPFRDKLCPKNGLETEFITHMFFVTQLTTGFHFREKT